MICKSRKSYAGQGYIEAVILGGEIPLIIPFNTNTSISIEQLKLVDGLILTGGCDVSPLIYGEESNHLLSEINPKKIILT